MKTARATLRSLAALCAASAAFLCAPAQADYVYDPKDLPSNFKCYEGEGEDPCNVQRRHAAWYEAYGARYLFWYEALLFRTDAYFAESLGPLPVFRVDEDVHPYLDAYPDWTKNLVEARYSIALNVFGGWAFAINPDAQLRLVRVKDDEEISEQEKAKTEDLLPTSVADTFEVAQAVGAFEEADLRSCEGAIAHLLAFPGQKARPLWNPKELPWGPQHDPAPAPKTLTITLDGDSVVVRARGVIGPNAAPVPQVSYAQSNGGDVYDWAKRMKAIVTPCLKPSEAVPPWAQFLDAQGREEG